jgi:GTP-binding protein HflX
VEAFRSTLQETRDAELLLHVVDATHPNAPAQLESVEDTLAELEVEHLPCVLALNKVDLLPSDSDLLSRFEMSGPVTAVSAHTGQGIEELLIAIEAALEGYLQPIVVHLPYDRGDLISLLHERGQVDQEEHDADGAIIYARLAPGLIPYFSDYIRP